MRRHHKLALLASTNALLFVVLLCLSAPALFAILGWLCAPPLAVHISADDVDIDVRRLGEYVFDLRVFEIRDLTANRLVWQAGPVDGQMGLWEVHLHAGDNPYRLGVSPEAQLKIIYPASVQLIHLTPGHRYEVHVTGYPIAGEWPLLPPWPVRARFSLPDPKESGKSPP